MNNEVETRKHRTSHGYPAVQNNGPVASFDLYDTLAVRRPMSSSHSSSTTRARDNEHFAENHQPLNTELRIGKQNNAIRALFNGVELKIPVALPVFSAAKTFGAKRNKPNTFLAR